MNNCLTQIAKKASHWKTLENLSNFFLHYFHYFSPFHLKTRYTPGTLWIHFFIQQLATEGNTKCQELCFALSNDYIIANSLSTDAADAS